MIDANPYAPPRAWLADAALVTPPGRVRRDGAPVSLLRGACYRNARNYLRSLRGRSLIDVLLLHREGRRSVRDRLADTRVVNA